MESEEDERASKAWVKWMLGDADMPVFGVALVYDLILAYFIEASAHERLNMIGRFPVLVDARKIVAWIRETSHIGDPRIVGFFAALTIDQRLELTIMRAEIERYLLRKRGILK